MGISSRFVTLYGVQLPCYKEFLEYLDLNDGIRMKLENHGMIIDGMDCEYVYFGHIYLKSVDMRWEAPEGSCEINPEELDQIREDYVKKIEEFWPEYEEFIDLLSCEWLIYSFVHYS